MTWFEGLRTGRLGLVEGRGAWPARERAKMVLHQSVLLLGWSRWRASRAIRTLSRRWARWNWPKLLRAPLGELTPFERRLVQTFSACLPEPAALVFVDPLAELSRPDRDSMLALIDWLAQSGQQMLVAMSEATVALAEVAHLASRASDVVELDLAAGVWQKSRSMHTLGFQLVVDGAPTQTAVLCERLRVLGYDARSKPQRAGGLIELLDPQGLGARPALTEVVSAQVALVEWKPWHRGAEEGAS